MSAPVRNMWTHELLQITQEYCMILDNKPHLTKRFTIMAQTLNKLRCIMLLLCLLFVLCIRMFYSVWTADHLINIGTEIELILYVFNLALRTDKYIIWVQCFTIIQVKVSRKYHIHGAQRSRGTKRRKDEEQIRQNIRHIWNHTRIDKEL